MESPSKIERRQAWALSSRRKFTVRDGEHRSPTADDQPHFSLQDDVFVDGCSAGKIESWLQGCGSEASPAKSIHLAGSLRTGVSFEDDLILGAEATGLYASSSAQQFSTPQQRLNLPLYSMGQSVASSAFSTTTARTASSLSEVLQMRAEDAEETLFQLGFGCEEPQVTARIPVRFFNFPSQLRGINFRLFLESQLSRIRQEDPCLSLASRFRQVEALTAMANAFYSLYSHVSRTPLQKLAPPQLTFTSPIVERSRSRNSVRSEPRSPVERLKDTISKMCLYTGSRGSDSTPPNNSPRKRKSSLSGVVEKSAENNNDDTEQDLCLQMEVDYLDQNLDWFIDSRTELNDRTCEENTERTDYSEPIPCESLSGMTSENVHKHRHRLEECTPCLEPKTDMDKKSKGCNVDSVHMNRSRVNVEPVPIITHDIICPQVVEYVKQAPYRCMYTNNVDAKDSHQAHQATNTPSVRQSNAMNVPKSLCQITITGWEDDTTFPNTQEQCSSNINSYLTPVKPPNLNKQGNSFELEEVHSAEEEEATSSEFCSAVTLSVSPQHNKSLPLRGDSFQSDSSGYVEEEAQQSHSSLEKT